MFFLPFPEKEDLSILAEWDRAGYPAGPGETLRDYCDRLKTKFSAEEALDRELSLNGKALVFNELEVTKETKIPDFMLEEAAAVTEKLYGFAFRKFPGFFLSEGVGFLWGGCLISDTKSPLSVFFLRNSFRNKKRFFIYRREELLAHELCHAARAPFFDTGMEEFFAYQTSPSRLRRYLGNCFIHQSDAVFFVLPSLLLLLMQLLQFFVFPGLPVLPFWIFAFVYPAWLLLRNQRSRKEFFRAAKHLRKAGFPEPCKILFRSTPEERKAFSKCRNKEDIDCLLQSFQNQLRWKVILFRFPEADEKPS